MILKLQSKFTQLDNMNAIDNETFVFNIHVQIPMGSSSMETINYVFSLVYFVVNIKKQAQRRAAVGRSRDKSHLVIQH